MRSRGKEAKAPSPDVLLREIVPHHIIDDGRDNNESDHDEAARKVALGRLEGLVLVAPVGRLDALEVELFRVEMMWKPGKMVFSIGCVDVDGVIGVERLHLEKEKSAERGEESKKELEKETN
jgi:hypothetical protein